MSAMLGADWKALDEAWSTVHAQVSTDRAGETHYWLYNPTGRPRVALLCSSCFNHRVWAGVASRLARRGAAVLVLDNRGCGLSTGDRSGGSSLPALLASDLAAALRHATWWPRPDDGAAVHIVGHAVGGLAAQELALAAVRQSRGGDIASLTLAATHSGGNVLRRSPSGRVVLAGARMLAVSGSRQRAVTLSAKVMFAPAFVDRRGKVAVTDELRPLSEISFSTLVAEMRAATSHDRTAELEALRATGLRTQVLAGTEDGVVKEKHAAELAAALGCQVKSKEGAGHMLMCECPQWFADSIGQIAGMHQ